jgi:hypothetical protein
VQVVAGDDDIEKDVARSAPPTPAPSIAQEPRPRRLRAVLIPMALFAAIVVPAALSRVRPSTLFFWRQEASSLVAAAPFAAVPGRSAELVATAFVIPPRPPIPAEVTHATPPVINVTPTALRALRVIAPSSRVAPAMPAALSTSRSSAALPRDARSAAAAPSTPQELFGERK